MNFRNEGIRRTTTVLLISTVAATLLYYPTHVISFTLSSTSSISTIHHSKESMTTSLVTTSIGPGRIKPHPFKRKCRMMISNDDNNENNDSIENELSNKIQEIISNQSENVHENSNNYEKNAFPPPLQFAQHTSTNNTNNNMNRRSILMALLLTTSTTSITQMTQPNKAYAYPGNSPAYPNNMIGEGSGNDGGGGGGNPNSYEIDDPEGKKVILQMSSKNIPQKYPSKNPPSSSSSSSSSSFTTNIDGTTSDNIQSTSTMESTTASSSSSSRSSSYNDAYFSLSETEERRIDVFQKAAPSVVYIDTFVEQRDAFSTNVMDVPLGTGSGFVWDERGHIVTNYHVVRNAQSAQVAILTKLFRDEIDDTTNSSSSSSSSKSSTSNVPAMIAAQKKQRQQRNKNVYDPDVTDFTRKNYKARVVGVDPGKDLAVLKIDAPVFDLYPIEVGTSKGLKVGQSAFAIGNPFGLDHTLTVGVVSGIGREVKSPIGRPITNVIQTDAAINPGNSGGPLLDSSGRLIGINTSIFSPSGASAGIGFAIPVDSVKFIVETLIRDKRVVRPILGITYLESKQAKALGISRGVLVLDVPKNSAAFAAGMRGTTRTESGLIGVGDIIIQIEDYKINTEADLFEALESFKPGDIVKVTVNRPDLESPNSTKLKLRQKDFNIQLKSSADTAMARYLFPDR